MREAASIPRRGPAHAGLDFQSLRRRGIEILQDLSGDVWTDYNEHDPGVTILEQLVYALTELSYRAEMPVDALLSDPQAVPDGGRRTALFAPPAILTSGPVSERDLRRLVIDRVSGVANVWLSPASREGRREAGGEGAGEAGGKIGDIGGGEVGSNGLREISVYVADPQVLTNAASRGAVCRAVRRVYLRHRRLCEDLGAVRLLRPAPATISGSLEAAADADPDAVLADVFHRLQSLLAPEPRRRSAAEAATDKRPPSEIFDGPRLRGAPIADDQLTERPTEVSLGGLTAAITHVAGVLAVRDLRLATPFGTIAADGAASLAVPPTRILQLAARNRRGDLGLRLFVRGVERRLDATLVEAELARRWAEHRRDIGAPSGAASPAAHGLPGSPGTPGAAPLDDAALRAYETVRSQFPLVYGIGPFGLPSDAGAQRRIQARQFKGYLHTFEQLLANYFARVAAARDVFSTARLASRPLWQALPDPGDDGHPVLAADYRDRLPAIAGRHDRALARRNRVLDLMLATYGESVGALWPRAAETRAAGDSAALRAEIRAKRQLLLHLPWLGRRRACGFDYGGRDGKSRRRTSHRCQSGLEMRSRIELGISPVASNLAGSLERAGVTLIGSAPPAERAAMIRHAHHIDSTFAPVPHIPGAAATESPMTVSEDLLIAASHPAGFRIGQLPDDMALSVVARAPSQSVWQLVGRYPSHQAALAAIATLVRAGRQLSPHIRRLTIVEHVLLRFGAAAQERLDSNFTATAVVALPGREAADPTVRQIVRGVLDAHAPAHIVLDVVYLRLSEAAAFDTLHAAWREALRQRRGRPLIQACRQMREFLGSSLG